MSIKWKYTKEYGNETIGEIEKYFNVKLPDEYIEMLSRCNGAKPDKDRFDIKQKKECVLDYFLDISDIINTSKRIENNKIIPIATDPFGNIIGFKIYHNIIRELVYWDHELKTEKIVADSFGEFIKILY